MNSIAPTRKPSPGVLIAGTTSDAGKTFLTAGLCRILQRRGVRVQPFKAQNMSLNSIPAREGDEIAVAQWLQCLAARVPPTTLANPLLLKYEGPGRVEIIVRGKPTFLITEWRTEMPRHIPHLRRAVVKALTELSQGGRFVVAEGAGSPVEMNLKRYDLANFFVAQSLGIPVILVSDLDRGGSLAQIVGTLELLDFSERSRVKGIILNRMRGDPRLLDAAVRFIERRTGVPVLGVVPYLEAEGFHWPEEDSLSLPPPNYGRNGTGAERGREGPLVGILRLPHISNFLDFSSAMAGYPRNFVWVGDPRALLDLDALLLPGSRRTRDDLEWMARQGFLKAIQSGVKRGLRVGGICGGYQMLGKALVDPSGFEGPKGHVAGLGLLHVTTTFEDPKVVRWTRAHPTPSNPLSTQRGKIEGYEIRRGRTERGAGVSAMFTVWPSAESPLSPGPDALAGKGSPELDGAVSRSGQVWGTALHGTLQDPAILKGLLDWASQAPRTSRSSLGVPRRSSPGTSRAAPYLSLDQTLDRVADHLEANLDLVRLGRVLGIPFSRTYT